VPLLVGGTMLYFKALTEGLSALPGADPRVRAELDAEASMRGWPALHAELASVDPAAASRIAPTDAQRIQRALEVFRVAGAPLSRLHAVRVRPALGPALAFAMWPASRAGLHEAIARRFDAMLDAGLVQELTALRARWALRADMPSMRSVGYRQAWRYLEGDGDRAALRARGIAATRQLAKRQLTWMRAFPAEALEAGDAHALDRLSRAIDAASASAE
jgi:tRNA dimethylallyltransferase